MASRLRRSCQELHGKRLRQVLWPMDPNVVWQKSQFVLVVAHIFSRRWNHWWWARSSGVVWKKLDMVWFPMALEPSRSGPTPWSTLASSKVLVCLTWTWWLAPSRSIVDMPNGVWNMRMRSPIPLSKIWWLSFVFFVGFALHLPMDLIFLELRWLVCSRQSLERVICEMATHSESFEAALISLFHWQIGDRMSLFSFSV